MLLVTMKQNDNGEIVLEVLVLLENVRGGVSPAMRWLANPNGGVKSTDCGMNGNTIYANDCTQSFISNCADFDCHDPIPGDGCNYGTCNDD